MAKGKTAEEIDPNLQNPDGTLKSIRQHKEDFTKVPELEKANAELAERVKALEDVLAEVQPLLHRFRRLLPTSRSAEDANVIYQQVRTVLKERGQEIDRTMRGG